MIYIEPHWGRIAKSAPDSIKNDMFVPHTKEEDKRVKVIGLGMLYNDLKAVCVLPNGQIVLIRYVEHIIFDGLLKDDEKLNLPEVANGDNDSPVQRSTKRGGNKQAVQTELTEQSGENNEQ